MESYLKEGGDLRRGENTELGPHPKGWAEERKGMSYQG